MADPTDEQAAGEVVSPVKARLPRRNPNIRREGNIFPVDPNLEPLEHTYDDRPHVDLDNLISNHTLDGVNQTAEEIERLLMDIPQNHWARQAADDMLKDSVNRNKEFHKALVKEFEDESMKLLELTEKEESEET